MHRYTRFALSCTPAPDSDLAALGKHWLGWDIDNGTEAAFLKIENLPHPPPELTAETRKFGFQAFLMAPFRLAQGHSPLDLHHTAQAVAARFAPISMPGLRLSSDADGLNLTPLGQPEPLTRYVDTVTRVFDSFRAASPHGSSIDDRGMTAAQQRSFDQARVAPNSPDFNLRFKISDPLPKTDLVAVSRVLRPIMGPNLPRPFVLGGLSLVGENEFGYFRLIQRYPLTGHVTASGHGVSTPPQKIRMPLCW